MGEKVIEDSYLGDGVYASFDGYHVVLDLRAQDNTTRIPLEPSVLDALFGYVTRIEKAMETVDVVPAVGAQKEESP